MVPKIERRNREPAILPKNNWYLEIGEIFNNSKVPLSDSRVEICVIKPKPVNKIEAQRTPEPSKVDSKVIENLNDIKIMNDNIADATIPCKERNSTLNSFRNITNNGFTKEPPRPMLMFYLKI